jgi:hypothetical protein
VVGNQPHSNQPKKGNQPDNQSSTPWQLAKRVPKPWHTP